ncbi:MAG: nucleotidyltransferase family protein [Thermodesulfovibrionales bacterium]
MDIRQTVTLLHALHKGDEQVIAQLRAITTDRWNNILSQLTLIGLAPLCFSRLANTSLAADVPAPVLQALQEEYFLHGARNMIIFNDLCGLLEALRPRGITAVVLKGGCLAEMVYGDIALRPMRDIDILVRKKDLEEVEQVLIGMGYGPAERPPITEQCRMHHHLIPFTRPGGPPIEVHWSLTPAGCRFPMTMEDLEEKTLDIHINGSSALMLCPGDLLVHLCLHICTNHRFSMLELRNLCDIAEVLLRYGDGIDWKSLGERTRRFGVGKYVYSTLLVAEKLFGAALPREGLAWLDHDDSDTEISEIIAGYLLDNRAIPLPDVFGELTGSKNLFQALEAYFRALLPCYDYLARKYGFTPAEAPSGLSLYLRHWTEALARGAHLLAHLFLRSKKARATVSRRRQEIIIHHWLSSGT